MRAWLLTALVLAAPVVASRAEAREPVVCIDPGHGGEKDGALGPGQQREKAITLQIAARLRAELLRRGFPVVMTRQADVPVELAARMRLANERQADLFVSVHCNSMPLGPGRARARGVETYFLSAEATGEQARRVAELENAEAGAAGEQGGDLAAILDDLARSEAHRDASTLASTVHQRLVSDLDAPDRGVHQAPFLVLNGARMPAILVEVGFLSNPAESRKLTEPRYQARIARSLAAAIAEFWRANARHLISDSAAAAPSPRPAAR